MPRVMPGLARAWSMITDISPSAEPSRPRTTRLTSVVTTETSRGSLNSRRLVVSRPWARAALIRSARRGSLRSVGSRVEQLAGDRDAQRLRGELVAGQPEGGRLRLGGHVEAGRQRLERAVEGDQRPVLLDPHHGP